MKTHKDRDKESIKIISVAAFCFSIVSCITTATGLGEFVFTDSQAWQAGLISFSIQSMLFIFNLRLPEYCSIIGKNIQSSKKIIDGLKRIFVKGLFLLLYGSVLVSSSLFSFVYIFDSSYLNRDISYIDADIKLTNEYNKALKETKEYIDEYLKVSEISMGAKLSELQSMLPDTDPNTKSEDELKEEERQANENYLNIVTERENKEKEIQLCDDTIAAYPTSIYGITEIVKDAHEKKTIATQELSELKKSETEAKIALESVQVAVENYKKNKEDSVKEFLTKLLQNDLSQNSDYLDDAMSEITDMIENYANDINIKNEFKSKVSENDSEVTFSDLVQQVQSLNITKEQYVSLRNARDKYQNGQYLLSENQIEHPELENEKDIKRWQDEWRVKYDELIVLIGDIPRFVGLDSNELISKNNINQTLLEKYKDLDIIDNLSKVKREYLSNINKIEKSWSLLTDNDEKYPFNVRFSAIFAVFLDLASLIVGIFIYYYNKNNDIETVDTTLST